MNLLTTTKEAQVSKALKASAPHVEHGASGDWLLASGDAARPIRARLRAHWLVLEEAEEEAGVAPGDRLWELVCANAEICGPGKLVLSGDELRARSELPIDEDESLAARLPEALASMTAVRALLDQALRPPVPASGETAPLAELCRNLGWKHRQRETGQIVVDLEVASSFYQAVLESSAGGSGTRIRAEVARHEALSESSERALARLLLSSNGSVRLIRGIGEEQSDAAAVHFEIRFGREPSAGELDHALLALATACDQRGREMKALGDETLARTYLAVRG
jgi:hypothetical protein